MNPIQTNPIFRMIAEGFKAHFYLRFSTAAISALIIVLGSGWIGIQTMARTYAGSFVIEMMSPVTDSIRNAQKDTDSTVASIQSAIIALEKGQQDGRRISEITIAAQRQADPKFDKAIKDMVISGELAKLKEEENRTLVNRLIDEN